MTELERVIVIWRVVSQGGVYQLWREPRGGGLAEGRERDGPGGDAEVSS